MAVSAHCVPLTLPYPLTTACSTLSPRPVVQHVYLQPCSPSRPGSPLVVVTYRCTIMFVNSVLNVWWWCWCMVVVWWRLLTSLQSGSSCNLPTPELWPSFKEQYSRSFSKSSSQIEFLSFTEMTQIKSFIFRRMGDSVYHWWISYYSKWSILFL